MSIISTPPLDAPSTRVTEHEIRTATLVQPLAESRWNDLVASHPKSSIFHTRGWLEALCRTYGYEPIAVTASPARAELKNAIVCCRVDSWLTGRRLVSLPFSDHCEPLVDGENERDQLLSVMAEQVREQKLLYIEIRPTQEFSVQNFRSSCQHYLHQIDLTPELDELFQNCHRSSTQRKIKRAEREGLGYEEGTSKSHLDTFYQLLLLTRRRQQLPPQPKKWFENLINCLGESLKIRIAFKGKRPIGSIITLRHKQTMVYKYGCSDAQFNNLGGMHLLLWRSIQEAKAQGLRVLDLGRSDLEATGLVTFKDRWGSKRTNLPYYRFAPSSKGEFASDDWKHRIGKRILSHVPGRLLTPLGSVFYRHIG